MKKICPFFCLYPIYKYIYIFYDDVSLYKRAPSRTWLDNALYIIQLSPEFQLLIYLPVFSNGLFCGVYSSHYHH